MNTLPELKYEYNALEPFIDEETMRIHHTKHHQAYIDKLNSAIKGTAWENKPVNEILEDIGDIPENIRKIVQNNGGGHSNHSFFWKIMTPKKEAMPKGIGDAIANNFGSFEKFKEEFSNAAAGIFGSGWAWLILEDEKLKIITTPNQDSPIMGKKKPVLGLDVWEHAYYLKYRNKRADYITAFWNIVNWEEVEKNMNL